MCRTDYHQYIQIWERQRRKSRAKPTAWTGALDLREEKIGCRWAGQLNRAGLPMHLLFLLQDHIGDGQDRDALLAIEIRFAHAETPSDLPHFPVL